MICAYKLHIHRDKQIQVNFCVMDIDQMKQIFHSLKEGSEDVISTGLFVDSIRNSALASNQEISQIVDCFDPSHCGFITFHNFKKGIEQLYLKNPLHTSFTETPVEISSPNSKLFTEAHDHNSTQSLLSFDSIDSLSSMKEDSSDSINQKYSDDLTLLDSLSASFSIDQESMSVLENKPNNDLSQMEEHFEFTPLQENIDTFKNDDNGTDEQFQSFSNGDSYNSINSNATFQQRNTWLRSSVRKNGGSLKRNSSSYASSPVYRNSTNNDSRRSSLSYESDEMNNDANLEEDVQNMNDKLTKLQEQIEILTEAQLKNEKKYSSMKRENMNLNDKINYLEEQIRDFEIQSDDKKVEDERRFKESMARLEREKAQELENYVNRILALQKELFEAKEEAKRHQQTIENLQESKSELVNQINDKEVEIETLKDEIVKLKEVIRKQLEESHANSTLIHALNQELSANRQSNDAQEMKHNKQHANEISNINEELENQVRLLKEENRSLKDSNEELTAQLLNNHLMEGKSLLKEGEAISSLATEISDLNTEQLKTTLKEQQDVNAKLRAYIDGILLNIVENYPQLLEVKPN